eukprot:4392054-Ditylum_brightwellii.AAC.1
MKAKENRPKVKVSWVKAHQDGKKDMKLLTLSAKMNVKADADVNLFRANTLPHLTPAQAPTVLLCLKVCLTVKDNRITGNIQQWLRDSYISSNIAKYIRMKSDLTISNMRLINCDNLDRALE